MKETEPGYMRRKQIMQYLQRYYSQHGYSPSFKEIGENVGLRSTSSVKRQLEILKALNKITFSAGIARTIRILSE